MDEPITPVVAEESGALVAQPPESVVETAEVTQEPSNEQPNEPSTDDTSEWLKAKGIDLNDPEATAKLAKAYREAEKKMHDVTAEAAKVQKDISVGTTHNGTEAARVSALETQLSVMNFKSSHPDWQEHSDVMNQLLNEPVTTSLGTFSREEYVQNGIFSLEDVYALAKAKANTTQKTENVQEVLQTIQNKQRAGGGLGNAVNSAPSSSQKDDTEDIFRKAFAK